MGPHICLLYMSEVLFKYTRTTIAFSDDIIISTRTFDEMKDTFYKLESDMLSIGMKFDPNKIKIISEEDKEVLYKGIKLKTEKTHKYLGQNFETQGAACIKEHITKGTITMNKTFGLNTNNRLKLWNTMCRSKFNHLLIAALLTDNITKIYKVIKRILITQVIKSDLDEVDVCLGLKIDVYNMVFKPLIKSLSLLTSEASKKLIINKIITSWDLLSEIKHNGPNKTEILGMLMDGRYGDALNTIESCLYGEDNKSNKKWAMIKLNMKEDKKIFQQVRDEDIIKITIPLKGGINKKKAAEELINTLAKINTLKPVDKEREAKIMKIEDKLETEWSRITERINQREHIRNTIIAEWTSIAKDMIFYTAGHARNKEIHLCWDNQWKDKIKLIDKKREQFSNNFNVTTMEQIMARNILLINKVITNVNAGIVGHLEEEEIEECAKEIRLNIWTD